MRSISILVLLLSFQFLNVIAQKPVRVKATYTYHSNNNETSADAERIALQRAKIKAIKETFGVNVSESAAGISSTLFDEDYFSSYTNSSVKGEWIETIGDPVFEYMFDDRTPVITCTVEGMVKEITGIRTEYEVQVLKNSPNERYASTDFKNGDEMYIYFKSPVTGYLNIFLLCHDDDSALCLLPYRDSQRGTFKVEADKEYFLFSKDKANTDRETVDEYTLTSERQIEFNDVVIIFSPDEYNKVSLKVKEEDLTAIKETSIEKFNKWIAKLQIKNNNITLSTIPIKISNQ